MVSSIVNKYRQYVDTCSTIGLICIAVVLTLDLAVDRGMDSALSAPVDDYHVYLHNSLYANQISAAISSLEYDLPGYLSYRKVYDVIEAGNISNSSIVDALDIENVEDGGLHVFYSLDFGFVDYARLSFLIFGYNSEGFLYLYFLIFSLSVALYYIAFRDSGAAKIVLVGYLLAHYMAVAAIEVIGPQVEVVYSFRFIAVLAILPAIHISALVLRDNTVNTTSFLIAFIQSLILVGIIWMRNSVLWIILFLLGWSLLWLGLYYFRAENSAVQEKQASRLSIVLRIILSRLWPILLVGCMVLVTKSVRPLLFSDEYIKEDAGHLFFHPLYIGLSIHPEIGWKYSKYDYVAQREGFFAPLCSNGRVGSNVLISYAKRWFCGNYKDNNLIIDTAFITISRYPNDQFGYSAAFKWLSDNGEPETAIFNFDAEDRIDYKSAFMWFGETGGAMSPEYIRPYSATTDMNIRKYEDVLRSVVLEIARESRWQIFELVFCFRPAQVTYYYITQYTKVSNLPPLLFLLASLFYILIYSGRAERGELKLYTGLLLMVFAFSLIVPLGIFPAYYAISETALALTLCVLYLLVLLASRYVGKYVVQIGQPKNRTNSGIVETLDMRERK